MTVTHVRTEGLQNLFMCDLLRVCAALPHLGVCLNSAAVVLQVLPITGDKI